MTKENRFEGLMDVVGKNKKAQTSKPRNDSDFKSESQAENGANAPSSASQTGDAMRRVSAHSDVQKSRSRKKSDSRSGVRSSQSTDISTSDKPNIQTSTTQADNSKPNISTSQHPNAQTSKKAKSVNPDYTRTTLYLPKKMHKKLKAIALEQETEMSSIVEELIEGWLNSASSAR